jgi:hypothetical protein
MPLVQTAKASGEFSAIYTGETTLPKNWDFFWFHSSIFNGSSFISFNNGTAIDSQNITIIGFYTSVAYIPYDMSLLEVSYKASWENESVTIFQNDIDKTNIANHSFGPVIFDTSLNFTNVPIGENSIEFVVKKGVTILDNENFPQTYKFASVIKTEVIDFPVNNTTVNNAISPTTPIASNNSPKYAQTSDEQNLDYILMLLIVFALATLAFRFLHKRKYLAKKESLEGDDSNGYGFNSHPQLHD